MTWRSYKQWMTVNTDIQYIVDCWPYCSHFCSHLSCSLVIVCISYWFMIVTILTHTHFFFQCNSSFLSIITHINICFGTEMVSSKEICRECERNNIKYDFGHIPISYNLTNMSCVITCAIKLTFTQTYMHFKCCQSVSSIIGLVIRSVVSASPHMKQHHDSWIWNQPSCCITTIFLIAFTSIHLSLKIILPLHSVVFLYASQVINLFCPLSFLLSECRGVVWQQNVSESCYLPPLIITGSSASCLSLWRGVRGQT